MDASANNQKAVVQAPLRGHQMKYVKIFSSGKLSLIRAGATSLWKPSRRTFGSPFGLQLSPSPLQLYLPELRKGARQTGKVHGGLAPTIVPLWQAWWWEDEEWRLILKCLYCPDSAPLTDQKALRNHIKWDHQQQNLLYGEYEVASQNLRSQDINQNESSSYRTAI